ncbi:phenylalanine--tRNA ligase subunit alpha [Candidatus Beckwithbacteria bacterium CG10_big_fil_rev_8_21_14_0_10_34_10]|uniref:Phenylalanine--tRNA ligase alpha subunit n=1 Tax=Candidatus Beckwithbacteria bacterium CG10_big_fil_rev_8_21_14_0_10_34_10 TaxID=1974495 RepID=A0A2H0WAI1_9BACT|nr:MAG: phenylalanine--tRNA ligase subunit alpha [Candidatus Beckwithbacteria bacterium CG10_big_fil_rev_8_21_14_0_10_34_10]
MKESLHNLRNEALALIQEARDIKEINSLKISFLGRKGKLNEYTKKFSELKKEEKIELGQLINELKKAIEGALRRKERSLKSDQPKKTDWFDFTLPGKRPEQGHLHLVSQAIAEISDIFEKIGFVRVRYPQVEWDWYAFEALNMPKNHPARDEWETLFIKAPPHKKYGQMVLTPQTSSGQIREMERLKKPPIKMINIAKCHRRQQDITHTIMFHQFEGLLIDKNISIANLKGVLDYFAKSFYGPERKTRLRPFHFNFTEPSFEVDINCPFCLGKGCRTCKSGWHELGGAGMVHPNVLKASGFDSKKYNGFAFGFGVERTFMMRSGIKIDDLRLFYSNDLRFLWQF